MKTEGHAGTITWPRKVGRADAAGIAILAAALLVFGFLRSDHNMFWGDEIMGWLTLRQPTFSSLLHVWREGLDSSGIWFYVLARPWLTLFGASERSLRMFSATGIAASAGVLWLAARRYYELIPVAATITFVYASIQALRWQLSNGRTYGVFMLASALAIYMIVRGEDEQNASPSIRFLLASAATYVFLAGSHILGSLYVATFLGTQVLLDLLNKRFRLWLYLSACCSVIVVLFSRQNIASTAALGKPSFWTVRPRLADLISMMTIFGGKRVVIAIVVLLAVTFLHLRYRRQRRPVYIILVGFLGLDLFAFVYSCFATSIYVDRYLLPFAMAAILLLCELLTQLQETEGRWPLLRMAAAPLLIFFGASVLVRVNSLPAWFPLPDYTPHLVSLLPPGVPVVDTDVGSFVEVEFYRRADVKGPFLFPVDWETALDKANTGGVSGFHEMDNFKRLGVDAADIVPSEQILTRFPMFTVLTTPSSVWFKRRILENPKFRATRTGTFAQDFTELEIWTVKGPS